MFVVAGASGNVGAAVVKKLSDSGFTVRALTRDASSEGKIAPLKSLPNVEIVECDLMDKSSFAKAFEGAKAGFISCPNVKQQVQMEKNFIDCAVECSCPYIVKNGTIQLYTSEDSVVEYGRFHAEIDKHLEAAAIKWTMLCPNWYMTNHLGDIFGTLPKNIAVYPLDPDAKASIIDPRDVGDVAAQLMVADDPSPHHGLKLDLSGPEPISLSEIAELYTEALGRPIQAVKCPVEAWVAEAVKAGLEEWMAQAVSHNFALWNAGDLAFPTAPEAVALAQPERTMAAWVKEWAPRSPPPS
jgi:uncharacterized protein YbjT (DUF2867 family)